MENPGRKHRWLYAVVILTVSAFPFAKLLHFPYKIPLLAIVCIAFYGVYCGHVAETGLKKIPKVGKFLLRVVAGFVLIELIFDFLIQPVINHLFNDGADYSSYQFLQGNGRKLGIYLAYMWLSAALGEEIVYRGFLFAIGEKLFQRKWIAVLLSSAIFSIAHVYQGWSGVALTFLFGVAFSLLFLFNRRNLWVNILVHGMIDSLFLLLTYAGRLSYYEDPYGTIISFLTR
jgi:membrane protease YdiL (CAAX protease family)